MTDKDKEVSDLLDRGTVDVIVREDLEKKIRSGRKLRVKLGIDPTSPHLHLGHCVPLRKLRQFQDYGHQVIFLIGGFTATIGDPTGKDTARPPLTPEQVEENAQFYLKQAEKILDIEKVELRNNREWLGAMDGAAFLRLMAQFTVGQMMERDMFAERVKKGAPVFCHEITYPMLQGYDSIPLKADVEIGGTDQLFNVLAARPLQKNAGMPEQNVVTVPIIEGTDGVEKMSKSLGNYIAVEESPSEMFGKVMSIPDSLMERYFELLTREDMGEVRAMIASDPRNAKVRLGKAIVTMLHDSTSADAAFAAFEQTFVRHELPDDMPEYDVPAGTALLEILTDVTGFCESRSAARRMIQEGGVTIDGVRVSAVEATLEPSVTPVTLKAGKRKFAKITCVG